MALFLCWPGAVSGQGRIGLGVQFGTADRFAVPDANEPGRLHGRIQGLHATVPLGSGRFGVGVDWSRVARLDVSPTGFEFREAPGEDRMSLSTASFWFAPICSALCVRVSGGVGHASYQIDVEHLSGDILDRYESDESTVALRFALSAEYGGRIRPTLTLADHYLPSVRPWWHHPSSATEMGVHMAVVTLGVSAYLF